MRWREGTHHQFKAITLVFLTHTPPPTIISHHHRWKTEKKSQDARMPGPRWNENESFSSSAEEGSGWKENLLYKSRLKSDEKKEKKNL
jgi:hypothetical protein